MSSLSALALLALLALPDPAQDERVRSFPEHKLTITFPPALADLQSKPGSGEKNLARWTAKVGEVGLAVDLYLLDSAEFGFAESDDVTETALNAVRDPRDGDPGFWYEKTELLPGAFGWASYAALAWGTLHAKDGTTVTGTFLALGGLLKEHGYLVEVFARPALTAEQTTVVLEFLRHAVAYAGPARNPKWTDEEVRERWIRDAPPATHKKLEKPLRTAHYVVIGNSSGSTSFAKAMEESYATIKKTFPFDEVAGRRLMPVFLFRTPDEYYEYYAKIAGRSIEDARRSKGHAWRDYYATWYEAPNDPVHIHEGTHQIFANRLHLFGGGSWFQEGVAEYIETSTNDRNPIANVVKKRKHVPLAEFVQIKSLLMSADENAPKGDAAGDHYKQAALLIEFLHDSKWAKARFPDFLRTVGRIPRQDLAAIERAVKAIYATDLAGLEDQWVEYCKKR